MIKQLIGHQEKPDHEFLKKFISKYQEFYSYRNKLFLHYLSGNNSQSDEFINLFCQEAFQTENEIWKMILTRSVAIHMKTLKECVDKEIG